MIDERPVFIPRTEAHPYLSPEKDSDQSKKNTAPLAPTETAIERLLTAIRGTIAHTAGEPNNRKPRNKSDGSDAGANVARCFVVEGERGTGKTTVLMSAAARCSTNKPRHELASRVRWLDILDVEPLMPSTNFLTILLVAVRRVLDEVDGKRRPSLIEERASTARGELDQLINDSALIWEEIRESTTRERAYRQIAVAEAYLEFGARLRQALASVGKALSELESGPEGGYVFILPIDNIDRSSDHLGAVFKLAQLVTCEHLCLVLAADRAELSLFLERAYWKEATHGSSLTKLDGSEEDEALAIAQRQAAATLRKILPPSNRIDLKLVAPQQALEFRAEGSDASLRSLLDAISLGTAVGWEPRKLLEMFEIRPDCMGDKPSGFTEVGRAALQMSARSLLDLWLLVKSSERERGNGPTIHRAIHIVRTMLRLAIAESKIPHWAAELLQERVVNRTVDDGTRIVIRSRDEPPYLELRRLRSLDAVHTIPQADLGADLEPSLEIRTFGRHELVMTLQDVKHGATNLEQSVLAWFLLLYDLLIQAPEPLVINTPADFLDACGPCVETRWTAWFDDEAVPIVFRWPAPRWPTVYDHLLMEEAWRRRLAALERQPRVSLEDLASSWIEVVVWVGDPGRKAWEADVVEPPAGVKMRLNFIEVFVLELQAHSARTFRARSGTSVRQDALHRWMQTELPRFSTGELGVRLPDFHRRGPSMNALRQRIKSALPPHLAAHGFAPTWVAKVAEELVASLEKR